MEYFKQKAEFYREIRDDVKNEISESFIIERYKLKYGYSEKMIIAELRKIKPEEK